MTDVGTTHAGNLIAHFASTLDPVGNPTQVVRTGTLSQTQTYTYDNSDRLLSVCFQAGTCPGGSDPFIRWTYDEVGNRLTEERPSGTTTYSYDAADRMLTAGSSSFGYDENGNETQAPFKTLTYDLANRLKTWTHGNSTFTYTYDGDGVRLQASEAGGGGFFAKYLWDVNAGLPQIALERDASNNLLRRYLYGARRISMSTPSATSYYVYDGLGSTANLISGSGTVQETYSYEPFGQIRTESGSAPTNFMKFTGEYNDPTGLYHLRARQYDPATGQFLGPDPADLGADSPLTSAYAYVANQPTLFIDPSGMVFQPSARGQLAARDVAFAPDAAEVLCLACYGADERLRYPVTGNPEQWVINASFRWGLGAGRAFSTVIYRASFESEPFIVGSFPFQANAQWGLGPLPRSKKIRIERVQGGVGFKYLVVRVSANLVRRRETGNLNEQYTFDARCSPVARLRVDANRSGVRRLSFKPNCRS